MFDPCKAANGGGDKRNTKTKFDGGRTQRRDYLLWRAVSGKSGSIPAPKITTVQQHARSPLRMAAIVTFRCSIPLAKTRVLLYTQLQMIVICKTRDIAGGSRA